jgi:hypothetical protein
MRVRELIAELEEFDGEMEVVLGISTRRGPDRAVEVDTLYGDGVKTIHPTYYGESDYNAVVLTEGREIGTLELYEED